MRDDHKNSGSTNSSAAKTDTRLALLYEIGRILAASETMREAAPQILEGICRHLQFDVGELWSPNEDAAVLRRKSVWHSPSETLEKFAAESRSFEFSVGEGLPGRVWRQNAPVWIENLSVENDLARRFIAERAGMQSAFAFPILLGGKFLGAFSFFCENQCPHDDDLLQMFAAVGGNIGQFIKRERTESRLRESEENFRALVQASSQAIWTTDPAGQNLEAYGWWENQTGQTRQESAGAGFLDVIHPDDRKRMSGEWQTAMSRVESFETECRINDQRGTYQYFAVRGVPVYNADGSFRQWIGTLTDISDRKIAEHSLKDNEARYRALVEATSTVVWRATPDGELSFVGAAWEKVSGQRVEEILGAGWLDALHPDDREKTVKIWRQSLASKKNYETEFRVLTTGGEYRWFAVRGVPVLNRDGSVREWVGANTDVHEHKLAEEKTRESEARYRSLFDSIDEGFCVIEVLFDAHEKAFDYRFLELNPPFEKMSGISAAEALSGKTVRELVPDFEEKWFEIYERVLRTGEPTRFVEVSEALNRWFDVYAFRIEQPENGKVAVLFNDITERKQAETNLAFLAEVSQDLARLASVDEIMQAVGAKIGSFLNLSVCAFFEINEAEDKASATHDWHRADVPSLIGVYRISEFVTGEFLRASRAGEIFVVRDTASDSRTDAAAYAALQVQSFVSVPLVRKGEWRSLLVILDSTPRDWRADEIELMREVTTRVWTRLERARTEESLRENQEVLSLAMSSSRMGAWSRDMVNETVYWSAELEEIFGLAAGTFSGSLNGFYDYVYVEDKDPFALEVQNALDERRGYIIEFRFRHADGSLRWMEGRGQGIYDDDGKPIKVYGIGIDITERKLADSALRESRSHLALALKIGRAGTFEWDIKNNVNRWSPEIEIMYGVPVGTFEGNYAAWKKRVVAEDGERVEREIQNALTAKLPDLEYEFRVILPDEARRWFVGRARFDYEENGEPQRMIGINVDVTERKQVEFEREHLFAEAQKAREIAEQANYAKDEFIALVSHELRSPLNAMLGWSRILQKKKADAKTSEYALDVIIRNALSQSRLIEDLLDIARLGKGKLRLELAPLELAPIINAAVETIKPTAEAKNIHLSQTIDRAANLITGDGDRLRQVVENLLSNAVKFTPEDGSVRLRLEREDGRAKLVISDTGQGISADFLPQIFERFKQADPSATRRHGGLGIGLSLARDLVELHGGTISAHSAGEGEGAIFTVTLPLRAVRPIKEYTGKVENMDSQGKLSGFWILAVDDEADAREIISFMLQINGARVTSANSAVEALEILTNANGRIPDILLSDISMPFESGYALLEKIRALPREHGGEIPAVALTAFNRPEDREAAFEAGFQKHLGKPVDMDALIDAIVETAGAKHV